MLTALKLEVTLLLVSAMIVTCCHGLKIDFSRLSYPRSRNYLRETYPGRGPLTEGQLPQQKRSMCQGNPCEPGKPFLCRDSPTCIQLKYVCDGKWDCEGGFDEDPAVCLGASRPPLEDIYKFLTRESPWIIPKLFNGADPEMVAHALTMASSVEDLRRDLGLTDKNVENIRAAFEGTIEGDERRLLKMGMPERSWPEVKYLLESLLNSNFHV